MSMWAVSDVQIWMENSKEPRKETYWEETVWWWIVSPPCPLGKDYKTRLMDIWTMSHTLCNGLWAEATCTFLGESFKNQCAPPWSLLFPLSQWWLCHGVPFISLGARVETPQSQSVAKLQWTCCPSEKSVFSILDRWGVTINETWLL